MNCTKIVNLVLNEHVLDTIEPHQQVHLQKRAFSKIRRAANKKGILAIRPPASSSPPLLLREAAKTNPPLMAGPLRGGGGKGAGPLRKK